MSWYITFESADTIVFSVSNMKYASFLNDGLYLFYSKETNVAFDPLNRLAVLLDTSTKYKYPKIQVPAGTNLSNYMTKEVRVGRGNYQEMELSVFVFKISIGGGNYWTGTRMNEFYEGAVQAYGPHDTVAVQAYAYLLKH
jgi:hypothetical protein